MSEKLQKVLAAKGLGSHFMAIAVILIYFFSRFFVRPAFSAITSRLGLFGFYGWMGRRVSGYMGAWVDG